MTRNLMALARRVSFYSGALTASLVPMATGNDAPPPTAPVHDERVQKLETFFESFDCPEPYHIDEYLHAADTYGLDYRLLPALSIRESTCGAHERLNNFWGWNSAHSGFDSVGAGINFVAHQLSAGRSYRERTLKEKLHVYNPYPAYPGEVLELMQQIGD